MVFIYILISLLAVEYFYQIVSLFVGLGEGKYTTKKDVYLSFIPIYPIVRWFKRKMDKIEE